MKQFRPSTVKIPERAHPLVRWVYEQMQLQNIGYDDLAKRAGVQPRTIRAWRVTNNPYLVSAEAVVGALGYELVVRPLP